MIIKIEINIKENDTCQNPTINPANNGPITAAISQLILFKEAAFTSSSG
jgi:hypothetical protein